MRSSRVAALLLILCLTPTPSSPSAKAGIDAWIRALTKAKGTQAVGRIAAILGGYGPLGTKALPALLSKLKATRRSEQWMLIRALGRIARRPRLVLPVLSQLCRTQTGSFSYHLSALVFALRAYGAQAKPQLLSLLKHDEGHRCALGALPALGSRASLAIPELIKFVKQERGGVREQAAAMRLLSSFGAKAAKAAPALHKSFAKPHQYDRLRAAALLALAHIKGRRVARRVPRWLRDKAVRVRVAAVRAAGTLRLGVALLFKALKDKDPEVKAAALTGLRRLPVRSKAALSKMAALLQSPHEQVLLSSLRAMGAYGARSSAYLPQILRVFAGYDSQRDDAFLRATMGLFEQMGRKSMHKVLLSFGHWPAGKTQARDRLLRALAKAMGVKVASSLGCMLKRPGDAKAAALALRSLGLKATLATKAAPGCRKKSPFRSSRRMGAPPFQIELGRTACGGFGWRHKGRLFAILSSPRPPCAPYGIDWRIRSFVGPLLSFEQWSFADHLAGGSERSWRTLDLRSGRAARLLDFFTDASLRLALQRDPHLRKMSHKKLAPKLRLKRAKDAKTALRAVEAMGLGSWHQFSLFSIHRSTGKGQRIAVRLRYQKPSTPKPRTTRGPRFVALGLWLQPKPWFRPFVQKVSQGKGIFASSRGAKRRLRFRLSRVQKRPAPQTAPPAPTRSTIAVAKPKAPKKKRKATGKRLTSCSGEQPQGGRWKPTRAQALELIEKMGTRACIRSKPKDLPQILRLARLCMRRLGTSLFRFSASGCHFYARAASWKRRRFLFVKSTDISDYLVSSFEIRRGKFVAYYGGMPWSEVACNEDSFGKKPLTGNHLTPKMKKEWWRLPKKLRSFLCFGSF